MGKSRIFFPQLALDQWLAEGRADITDGELVMRPEGRRYRVLEAVRVLTEVSGTPDPNELLGKVKTTAYLLELGAELLGDSMIIGDNAYEVVSGFLGTPVGSFAEHRRMSLSDDSGPPSTATTDEELLAQYLIEALE
ncbi:MAG: hypothetical protein OZ921_04155 [Sorangiineae bacterium]|nr:hypothetical protein [Polyangiaceae bacterium]MEB2321682.1 hypothetical protein [Sorangiineae bacterium]